MQDGRTPQEKLADLPGMRAQWLYCCLLLAVGVGATVAVLGWAITGSGRSDAGYAMAIFTGAFTWGIGWLLWKARAAAPWARSRHSRAAGAAPEGRDPAGEE